MSGWGVPGPNLRNEGISRPLCEQAQHGGEEESTPHARCVDEIHPRFLGHFQLQLDRRLHLGHFCLHELGTALCFAVVLHENLICLLAAILGDQPSGALGEEAGCSKLVSG